MNRRERMEYIMIHYVFWERVKRSRKCPLYRAVCVFMEKKIKNMNE